MYILMVLVLAAVIVYSECLGGGNITMLVDIPSVLMLLAVGIPMLAAAGLGKDFLAAFRLALGKEQEAGLEKRKRALEAVKLFMKAMRYGGIFFTLLPLNNICFIADDLPALAANIGVALVVLLYAYAINLLLLPIKSRLEVGIIEYMESAEMEGNDREEGEMTGSGE